MNKIEYLHKSYIIEYINTVDILEFEQGKLYHKAFYENDVLVDSYICDDDNRRISYVKPEFFEAIKTQNLFHSREYNDKGNYKWYDELIISKPNIMKDLEYNRFMRIDHSSHLFFQLNSYPLSSVYRYNYINGRLDNNTYWLDELLEYLQQHSYIVNKDSLYIQEIPYYNQDEKSTHFIDIAVKISQQEYNELWDVVRDLENPSCRIKEMICSSHIKKWDVLNIHQFLK